MTTDPTSAKVTREAAPDQGIRLHRRQFVIGPVGRSLGSDWLQRSLYGGLVLSHCPELRLLDGTDQDGVRWTLLGLAAQSRSDLADPITDLELRRTRNVQTAYESWTGRWTLIGDGELHLDATGQLPCHWFVDHDGATWASSSPAVIAAFAGTDDEQGRDLIYERGLSWVAPPLGTARGALRLLPSQILDLPTGTTRTRRLVTPADELELAPAPGESDSSGAMTGFMQALGHAMARLPAGEPKHMALTAGADSRLVLAAALAADVQLDLFTRRSARMSVADREIPPRLAAAVGMEHREIVPGPFDPKRLELAAAHTDGHVSAGDALPFVHGVRDRFTGVEIGGQGFGAGKVKNRQFPPTIGDAERLADRIADHFGEPRQSFNRRALAAWLIAVRAQEMDLPPGHLIDWRDRFYLEQRTAGWQAAKEQLYDLHRHQRFFPINSARTFGLLLAIDPAVREDGGHRRLLLSMTDERLLSQPFNPKGNEFSIARRIRHLLVVDRKGLPARVGQEARRILLRGRTRH